MLIYATAFFAWLIAAFTLGLAALLANPNRFSLYSRALWKINLIAAFVLIFIAIDIINPFPFLSTPLSSILISTIPILQDLLQATKLSSIMLLIVVLLGTFLALKTTKIEEEESKETISDETLKQLRDDSLKSLRLMTLLPIAVQFWVLVATDQLVLVGETIAIGLFILSGPASWQFAIRVVMFSKDRRSGLIRIAVTLLMSLAGTMVSTLFGVYLKGQTSLVSMAILPYLASFSLVIIPYSFFYSHWGETWRDARPLGAVMGLIIFTLLASLTISDPTVNLLRSLGAWFVLLMFPYVAYSQEFVSEDFQCPRCAAKGVSPKYRTYRGRRFCLTCRKEVEAEKELVEESPSLQSWVHMLILGFLLKPSAKDVTIEIDPAKKEYKVGEAVGLKVHVTPRANKIRNCPIECKVDLEPRIGKLEMPIEESEAAMIEPDKTNTFHFDWIIPSLAPSRIPKEKEKVVITAKVVTLGYKPKGKAELYFPRTFHTKKRSSLIINVLS